LFASVKRQKNLEFSEPEGFFPTLSSPLPGCDAEMKVIAVIEDPDELLRILQQLVKIGRSPPGFDPHRLN